MLIGELLTDVMREAIAEWISDKFLTVSLDPNDYCAFPTAARFLARHAMDNDFLLQKLGDLHHARVPFHACGIDSDDCARSAVGKVGLKNLGNTCYLNSVLQQLFAIEPFRNFVLCLAPASDFHRELRTLFWLIHSSNSRFVSPAAFVSHYLLHGRPLNPHEQQDAVEILQDLLSRFDSDQEVSLLFSGTLQNTITGGGIEKTVVEQILTLDLEVAEHASLTDSFRTLVRPESLVGANQYRREDDALTDAVKATLVGSSPPVLILHLNIERWLALDIEREAPGAPQDRRRLRDQRDNRHLALRNHPSHTVHPPRSDPTQRQRLLRTLHLLRQRVQQVAALRRRVRTRGTTG
jgi:hypothetical protein